MRIFGSVTYAHTHGKSVCIHTLECNICYEFCTVHDEVGGEKNNVTLTISERDDVTVNILLTGFMLLKDTHTYSEWFNYVQTTSLTASIDSVM